MTILVKFGWENPPGKQKKTAFWGTEDSPKGLYPWTLGQSQGKKTIEIATNWQNHEADSNKKENLGTSKALNCDGILLGQSSKMALDQIRG